MLEAEPPAAASPSAKVLVVDDSTSSRCVLNEILIAQGYGVVFAENGVEALKQVERESPDIVLMDLWMPVMDGIEAARRIKQQQQQQQYIPIIFLTSETDEHVLARCLAAGGDDFMSKPYGHVLLKAKIEALLRTRKLYIDLQAQKETLAAHEELHREEFVLAERIYNRIVRASRRQMRNVKYLLRPMDVFSGDLILAAETPSGRQQFLLGDFTGHGLPAAIGAMVVFDIFYGMSSKGFPMGQTLMEINRKLLEILPPGHFLAACMVEFTPDQQIATIWNGGLPPVLLRGDEKGSQAIVPSTHLPLGIVPGHEMDFNAATLRVSPDVRILVQSDGVIEARNPRGEMFGSDRLDFSLRSIEDPEALFDGIVRDLQGFMEDAPQSDDISLLEITCDPMRGEEAPVQARQGAVSKPPMNWKLSLGLCASALREMDPLPSLLQLITDIQGLQPHREHIYTVLAELYSNALEHGILGLDSDLKHSPDGFDEYYRQRQKALEQLSMGGVRLEIQHSPAAEGGGQLALRVEHTGKGFDHQTVLPELTANDGLHGRGIKLVRSICQEVNYFGEGNAVEAVYQWK
jgi:CheY-like chemotaxis protein